MRRKFFEKGQRHMGTVDKNGAFPRTRYFAYDDQLIIAFDLLRGEQCGHGRVFLDGKNSLHAQKITAAAYDVGRDTLSEDCPQCTNQNGLARTGFTREDVQSCAEFDCHLFQKGKILNS